MELENTETVKVEQITDAKIGMRNAGIFFFLVMVMELPYAFLVRAIAERLPSNYYYLVSILMTQGYMLVCGLIFMAVTKTKFKKDLKIKKFRVSSFFLSLIVLITAAPMATWLNAFSQLFAKNEIAGGIFEITEMLPAWLGVMIIGCLPGFIEEMLYRGILFSAFKKRSVLTGIIVSAVSFGFMHMNFNQIMYAVYLGIIFALLVEATGSLISTMILHMLFNAMNTLYLYILPKLFEFLGRYSAEYVDVDLNKTMSQTASKPQIIAMLVTITPFAIGGLVLTILLIKQIAKMNGREFTWNYLKGDKDEVKKTKPVTVCLILGWLFCLINATAALFY